MPFDWVRYNFGLNKLAFDSISSFNQHFLAIENCCLLICDWRHVFCSLFPHTRPQSPHSIVYWCIERWLLLLLNRVYFNGMYIAGVCSIRCFHNCHTRSEAGCTLSLSRVVYTPSAYTRHRTPHNFNTYNAIPCHAWSTNRRTLAGSQTIYERTEHGVLCDGVVYAAVCWPVLNVYRKQQTIHTITYIYKSTIVPYVSRMQNIKSKQKKKREHLF